MDPFLDDFDRYFDRRMRQMFNPDFWGYPSFSAIEPSRTGGESSAVTSSSSSQRTQPFVSTRLDLVESANAYKINVELPGVRKEDIKLNVEGDVLTVEAERKETIVKDDDERCHYSERRFGRIKRQVTLPPAADTKQISATFDNGVLQVEMAKSPETEKRLAIDIK